MTEITTSEALDVLPVGSVWRTASGALGETITPRRGMARVRVEGIAHLTMTMGGDDFPLTVLYRPDRPSDLAALRDRLGHIVSRYGDAHDAQDCAVLHDLRALLAGAR